MADRINFARLKRDLETLGAIGRTPEGGVSRPSWSAADAEARRWLVGRLQEDGFEARVDPAGNIFGRWLPGRPVVLTGSHIDSVPNGGRFDGALGVLSALECMRTIRELGMPLKAPLELVAFTDEEGAFGGFLGSRAFTGVLRAEEIPAIRNTEGLAVIEAMARHGMNALNAPMARRDPAEIRAYVELHIEQGPILEVQGIPIGIVEGIVGIRRQAVTFRGRADHAGPTPLDERRDALLGAADFTLKVREMVLADGTPHSRVTVGVLRLRPDAANIVPGEAFLSCEIREQEADVLAVLAERARRLAGEIALRWGLEVSVDTVLEVEPVPLSEPVQEAIGRAAEALAMKTLRMKAMAGHDAQVVGRVAPAGMIFVPSRNGRSHSPLECTSDEDCERGANVLLHTLLALAG